MCKFAHSDSWVSDLARLLLFIGSNLHESDQVSQQPPPREGCANLRGNSPSDGETNSGSWSRIFGPVLCPFQEENPSNQPHLWGSGWSFFRGNRVSRYPRRKASPTTAEFWPLYASFPIDNIKILSNLYNVTQKCNASNLNGSWNALNQVLSFSQSFRNRCKKGLRNQPCQHSQRFRNVRSSCSPSIQLQACINLFEFARFQFEAKLSSPAGA